MQIKRAEARDWPVGQMPGWVRRAPWLAQRGSRLGTTSHPSALPQ